MLGTALFDEDVGIVDNDDATAVLTCLPERNDSVEGRGVDGAEGWVDVKPSSGLTDREPIAIVKSSIGDRPVVATPPGVVVTEVVCPPNVEMVAVSLTS